MSKKKLALSFCVLGALWGCNDSKGPKVSTYPVTGTVTYEGKPVEGASVVFMSKHPDGPTATGDTDAEGRFSLTTYVGPKQILKGAVPDEYRVSITKAPPPEGNSDADDPNNPDFEKHFQRMIKQAGPIPGANKNANTGPAPRPKISLLPEKYANPDTSGLKAVVVTGQNDPIEFKLSD